MVIILVKSMRVIKIDNLDKELFDKIEKIVTTKRDIGVGKIYTPTEESFKDEPVSNKIIISVDSIDGDSNSILASMILNELRELKIEFKWELCSGPGIRFTFKGERCSMEEESFRKIISKNRSQGSGVIGTIHGHRYVYGANFHLHCQNHVYDELLAEIIDDFKRLGYDFDISYYYIG